MLSDGADVPTFVMASILGARSVYAQSSMRAAGTGPVRELACFAGAGGGLLGSTLLGWDTVCAIEIEPYCRRVLMQRQLDGCLPVFPIWDDIRTFDGKPWRGCIDVVSGGFPCQDISSAGKRAGLDGAHSGLWFEMLRVIGEIRPAYVFAENSPDLRTRGLGTVLSGLASLGYDAAWGVLGAWEVGAPHPRERLWIAAHMANAESVHGRERLDAPIGMGPQTNIVASAQHDCVRAGTIWELSAQHVDRVVDGVACRVDRVRAAGNGQVPIVAATAWEILSDVLRHAHQHGGHQ